MLLFYSSYGDEEGLTRLVEQSERSGKYNVALEAAYLLGDADKCIKILLKSKRVAEAAMFARAYAPSKIPIVMKQWEDLLKQRELPFQPENLLKYESLSEMMQSAIAVEAELQTKFYSQPRGSAQDIETLKEEYYADFAFE